jgi:hypothetical protein
MWVGEPAALNPIALKSEDKASPLELAKMADALAQKLEEKPENLQGWVMLARTYRTLEQFDAAISYIDAHYEEVESEYQIVVQQAEEIRDYWNKRNKECIANISKLPPKPEYASAWQKLQARKAKRAAISQ